MGIRGAILGDIAGSRWEFNRGRKPCDWKNTLLFETDSKFSDDTVMSIACKRAIDDASLDFEHYYRMFGNKYPNAGYGGMFGRWLKDEDMGPYGSFGNGSAMRVSYVGECCEKFEDVAALAAASAICTHNHEEGIKGAVATAEAIWLAGHGETKDKIKTHIEKKHRYNLSRQLKDIRGRYAWSSTCQGSVPESIICFLESDDWDSCLRNVLSLQGDTDTMGAISGAIAESFYGDTSYDATYLLKRYLDQYLLSNLLYE
jgi:ADP-ribosylglycohydrolase